MEKITVLKNVTVVPMTHETAFDGGIAMAGDRIILVTQDRREIDRFIEAQHGEVEVVDGRGGAVLPGLINLHNHVSMTLLRSFADDIPLMPWLTDYIWPVEDKMTPQHVYEGARIGMAEMLLGGTTCFVDMYGNEDQVARAAEELHMRVMLGLAFTDGSYPKFESFAGRMIAEYGGNDRVMLSMSPHAPYTCSPETMKKAVAFAKRHNLTVHTHVAETRDEIDQIAERYGKTPVEYFDGLGLFDLKTIAAHCVYVTEKDMEILRDKGVSVSHNPQSNLKLASGFAPVAKMIEKGINVGIGTDGPSSNNDLDMWDELRTAAILQKAVANDPKVLPAYRVLEMATVHGARAIGRDDLGTIAVGKTADLVLVDLSRPHYRPHHDVIAALVYCGKASDVRSVWVGGECVVEDGRLTTVSLEDIYEGVDRAVFELGIE